MTDEELVETPQRWTARRRAALVLSLLRGETSAAEAARKHGLTVAQVEEWRELFLAGAENSLRSRPREEEGLKDEQIKKLQQKVGELVLDIDVSTSTSRRKRCGAALSALGRPTSDRCGAGAGREPHWPGSRAHPAPPHLRLPPAVGAAAPRRGARQPQDRVPAAAARRL